MTVSLSPRIQRVAALSLPILFLALFWTEIVEPISDSFDDDQQTIAQMDKVLAGYQREAAGRTALEAQIKAAAQQADVIPGAVTGANAAMAAADLQGQIRKVIESHTGEVKSAQNSTAAPVNGFEAIELRYDFAAPTAAIADILYEIETHNPYLFVDALEIHVPENASEDGRAIPSIHWVLHAYRAVAR